MFEGYVAATDFNVLAQQQALMARELFLTQKFANQRQQAIKVACELKESGTSETALKLIEESERRLEDILGENQSENATLAPRLQMKLLCSAVGAVLTFNDFTKVGRCALSFPWHSD